MTQTVSSVSEVVLKRFSALLKNASLAHAYLFTGPVSVGKFETALAIAKLVNCEKPVHNSSCGVCASCIKIDKGSHPDIYIFDAITKKEADAGSVRSGMRIEKTEDGKDNKEEGKSNNLEIRISQIHFLSSRIQLRPFEAAKKVFIVKNADDLNQEAANALLKTLEEPSPNSLLILTSAFPQNIFDTIKSRCHMIQFFALTQDKLEAELIKGYDVDKKAAHF